MSAFLPAPLTIVVFSLSIITLLGATEHVERDVLQFDAEIFRDRLERDAILHDLNRAGIAASLGSACGSCSIAPSHVLHGAVRLSLPRETTLQETDQVVAVLSNLWLTCAPTRGSMLNQSMHRGPEN
ncbi:cysteine sulfinate desulfinase/cysteine desulfurase-like protein [Bradyrhizobium sp. LB14.3]